MINKKWVFSVLIMLSTLFVFAQEQASTIPSVILKDINGKSYDTAKLTQNKGNPVIICFMKTCCTSPTNMLDNIADVYDEWQEKTGVILYVISTDDARSTCRVAPLANAKEWKFQIFLDPNSDFKRRMNVIINPHTFVLNGDGKIIWQKAGYAEGDEDDIYDILKKQ